MQKLQRTATDEMTFNITEGHGNGTTVQFC